MRLTGYREPRRCSGEGTVFGQDRGCNCGIWQLRAVDPAGQRLAIRKTRWLLTIRSHLAVGPTLGRRQIPIACYLAERGTFVPFLNADGLTL